MQINRRLFRRHGISTVGLARGFGAAVRSAPAPGKRRALLERAGKLVPPRKAPETEAASVPEHSERYPREPGVAFGWAKLSHHRFQLVTIPPERHRSPGAKHESRGQLQLFQSRASERFPLARIAHQQVNWATKCSERGGPPPRGSRWRFARMRASALQVGEKCRQPAKDTLTPANSLV